MKPPYTTYLWNKYEANIKAISDIKVNNRIIVQELCKQVAKEFEVEQVLMSSHGICSLSFNKRHFIDPNSANNWKCVYCGYDINQGGEQP